MKLPHDVVEELKVASGGAAALDQRSTRRTDGNWLGQLGHDDPRDVAERDLGSFRAELEKAQGLLYANGTWALLVVLQGLDTAGKDSTIKHVLAGANPLGCHVVSFRQPSRTELAHDFLWRCAVALPERGHIGIFNRSYFEEVLVCRVHPELLQGQHLPGGGKVGKHFWEERYEDINCFERHLVRSGTRVVKMFLHISKDEQRRRLLKRLDEPNKRWKFSSHDLAERAYFDTYRQAYEEAISATSTPWAPWYVVPSDHKLALHALVGGIVVHELDQLKLGPPSLSGERQAELAEARRALEADGGSKGRQPPRPL